MRLEVPVLWKDYCKNMMQTYTERTTGSFMEESKVASLTWHYGNTDPQVSVCRSVCRFVGLFVGLFCFADVELWQHRSSSCVCDTLMHYAIMPYGVTDPQVSVCLCLSRMHT